MRLLVAGLDAAGKTSALAQLPPSLPSLRPATYPEPWSVVRARAAILYKLKAGPKKMGNTVPCRLSAPPPGACPHTPVPREQVSAIPTMNFNVETCKYKKIKFSVWVRARRPRPLHAHARLTGAPCGGAGRGWAG